ncbi:MAG TPA: hypothetical protein VIK83_00545, partial [Coriobacteriia bacterium]
MAYTQGTGRVRILTAFALTAALTLGFAGAAQAAEVAISQPVVSASAATFGKVATFSAVLAPGDSASLGAKLDL